MNYAPFTLQPPSFEIIFTFYIHKISFRSFANRSATSAEESGEQWGEKAAQWDATVMVEERSV